MQEDDIKTGRRSAPRARLQALAKLETTSGTLQVRLVNLSCTGAKVEVDRLVPLKRTVILKRGDIEAYAQVVWSNETSCGLEFFDPIPHDLVVAEARKSPEPPPKTEPSFWLEGGMREQLSPAEWRAAKAWAERVGGRRAQLR
jgi:hypothetical protein